MHYILEQCWQAAVSPAELVPVVPVVAHAAQQSITSLYMIGPLGGALHVHIVAQPLQPVKSMCDDDRGWVQVPNM